MDVSIEWLCLSIGSCKVIAKRLNSDTSEYYINQTCKARRAQMTEENEKEEGNDILLSFPRRPK